MSVPHPTSPFPSLLLSSSLHNEGSKKGCPCREACGTPVTVLPTVPLQCDTTHHLLTSLNSYSNLRVHIYQSPEILLLLYMPLWHAHTVLYLTHIRYGSRLCLAQSYVETMEEPLASFFYSLLLLLSLQPTGFLCSLHSDSLYRLCVLLQSLKQA